MYASRWCRAIGVAALFAVSGCGVLKTPFWLEQLNGTDSADTRPPRATDRERVAALARDQLADSYFEPVTVAKWMRAMGPKMDPMQVFLNCITDAQAATDVAREFKECVRVLGDKAVAWGLPDQPPESPAWTVGAKPNAELLREADAQRFLANVVGLATTLVAMQRGLSRDDFKPLYGVGDGAIAAADYLDERGWHRRIDRHNPAIVLSGGSANGAFSAGAIWRLLEILKTCRADPDAGCPGAQIDLVVGTSTGTLIGAIVDLFFTEGHEQEALDLLVDRYTCSVESDLYCAEDEYVWHLATDLKGLMRFDGIEKLLKERLAPASITNETELVAVSVQLEDGNVYGESDLDPLDSRQLEPRIQALMASIVLPVFAKPVEDLLDGSRPKFRFGTYLDGGMRSVVPVLEAVNRGADRVLVLSNSPFEPTPANKPESALEIMMRGLDVVIASGVTEPQMANMRAVTRRWAEYNLCLDRLESWLIDPGLPAAWMKNGKLDKTAQRTFCERRELPADEISTAHKQAVRSNWSVTPQFPQVASSFRASYFFLPEGSLSTASGYAFRPDVMRPLFIAGAESFQRRCKETCALLGITGEVVKQACAETVSEVVTKAKKAFGPMDECMEGAGELRLCED